MTRIVWDTREFQGGLDRGVLYPNLDYGVPWNGLTKISESDDSAAKFVFIDGQKVYSEFDLGNFSAVIEAITYPDEFDEFDGYSAMGVSNQRRKCFNLSYRTMVGDHIQGLRRGYKIHLVYNAQVGPSNVDHKTLSPVTTPDTFSWALTTLPIPIPDFRNSSHLIIDSTKAPYESIQAIEDILYGTDLEDSRFPTIEEIFAIFEENAVFKVINHGDGSATIIGPDDAVFYTEPTVAEIRYPSVEQISSDTYKIRSM